MNIIVSFYQADIPDYTDRIFRNGKLFGETNVGHGTIEKLLEDGPVGISAPWYNSHTYYGYNSGLICPQRFNEKRKYWFNSVPGVCSLPDFFVPGTGMRVPPNTDSPQHAHDILAAFLNHKLLFPNPYGQLV
jgi:hypothetical protein